METHKSIILIVCLILLVCTFSVYSGHKKKQFLQYVFDNRSVISRNLYRLNRISYLPISIENIKYVRQRLDENDRLENKLVYPDYPMMETENRLKIANNLCDCISVFEKAGVPLARILQEPAL